MSVADVGHVDLVALDMSHLAMDPAQSRVLDYLDDKIQASSDLAELDALLQHVTSKHGLLKQQLHAAQLHLDGAQRAATLHHNHLAQRAAAFHHSHADMARRLLVISSSETSDDAVPRFRHILDTLHRLDIASGYMELLTQVHVLSHEAALAPYHQLRHLHQRLLALQDNAEGAAPQLLHHVATLTTALRTQILHAFSSDLDAILKKIHWPTPKAAIPGDLQQPWETAITKLLELQMPELDVLQYANTHHDMIKLPPVLFPFKVLAQPLEMRFRYHFDADTPTNRIDKPEYFLGDVTKVLDDYSTFITDHVQPILLERFRGTNLALNPVYVDAMSAFITALLPMLRTKIQALLPRVVDKPQLISHLMHQVMIFDTNIREAWGYDAGCVADGWKGLSWECLVEGNWFAKWLQVEKDFALSRYSEIVQAKDFGHLDYESVDPKATKPTIGAIRVNHLLETITDRYRRLSDFDQKLAFLMDIQIAIFDKLHERLKGNLDAYLSNTTLIGRTMTGVSKEEQDRLLGEKGLETLCKTFGSADYLERAMRDWSDDVFFLDIWEELQDRACQKTNGSMSVSDVAERTSKAVEGEGDRGSLFDETASWYARLRENSEKIIIDTLRGNAREAMRPYIKIHSWATLSSTSLDTLSPTSELTPLLNYLTTSLSFLSRALASAPLRRITRSVLITISATLWKDVLNHHRFSTSGAAQLRTDVAAICYVVNEPAGAGVAEAALRKCLEACQLVSLPVKGAKQQITPLYIPGHGAEEDDVGGWDAWDAEGEGGENSADANAGDAAQKASHVVDEVSEPTGLGLWEVEKRLFADNQSARDVLDALGLEMLDENEARALLRGRVEIAG